MKSKRKKRKKEKKRNHRRFPPQIIYLRDLILCFEQPFKVAVESLVTCVAPVAFTMLYTGVDALCNIA